MSTRSVRRWTCRATPTRGRTCGSTRTRSGCFPAGESRRMSIIGLDLGHTTTVAAEHWLARLPPVPGLVACTHFGGGRVLITLAGLDPAVLPPDATPAVDDADGPAARVVRLHAAGTGGRAVRYPGVERLVGSLPVA